MYPHPYPKIGPWPKKFKTPNEIAPQAKIFTPPLPQCEIGGFGGLVAKDVDALDLRMAGQIIPENRFLGTPEDLDAIVAALYDYLHNYANTFYGKAFVVTIPSISTTTDTETGEIQHSDIPSPDGAWPAVWSEDLTSPAVLTTAGTWVDATNLSPEGRMYILGNLPNPSVQMDVFKQDNGLVTPILKYSGPSFIKSATSVVLNNLIILLHFICSNTLTSIKLCMLRMLMLVLPSFRPFDLLP